MKFTWRRLNPLQRRIAIGATALLALMLLFPPVSVERRFSGLTDGSGLYELQHSEFVGWGFVTSLEFEREYVPEPGSFEAAWRARTGSTLAELRKGVMRFNTPVFLLELILLAAATGPALYLTRSKSPADH